MNELKVVTKDRDQPIAAEILTKSITEIGKHFKTVLDAGFEGETQVTLTHDSSGIAKGTIRVVLDNLEDLEATSSNLVQIEIDFRVKSQSWLRCPRRPQRQRGL